MLIRGDGHAGVCGGSYDGTGDGAWLRVLGNANPRRNLPSNRPLRRIGTSIDSERWAKRVRVE